MSTFSCGHSPDKELSMNTVTNEKLIVPICNNCYDNHKEDIQKYKLDVGAVN